MLDCNSVKHVSDGVTIRSGGAMYFRQFYLGCLAHASYLIGSGGEAAVIDPQRDSDIYLEDARAQGLAIKYVIETHCHADFVSGHHELAARTGGKVYFGSRAAAKFDFVPVGDGSEIVMGDVTLRFIETPGHTPESISILVFSGYISPEKAPLLEALGIEGFVQKPFEMAKLAGAVRDVLDGVAV